MPDSTRHPLFTVERDPIGIGFRIAVEWPDGSLEYVTGMGSEVQARHWIENDAISWADQPDRLTTPRNS